MSLSILFQDRDILVIDKPPNIHSVSQGAEEGASIAKVLLSLYPECQSSSPKPEDGGLVNRLDYETTGILIAARSREVWEHFKSQFRDGLITKRYFVILGGRFKEPRIVEGAIGSRYRRSKKVTFTHALDSPSERTLQSRSYFELFKYDDELDVSFVWVTASTGRRHQVRVHASHLGHPLVGDSLYGSKRHLPPPFGSESRPFFLHAASMTLIVPSGIPLSFFAPLPIGNHLQY